MVKTARFMRMTKVAEAPPEDYGESTGWWVTAALFKVNPPMEFTTYETYRNGRLLHKETGMRIPHRDRVMMQTPWRERKRNPKYSHRSVRRTTAFVISSAADLATMMDRSNKSMIERSEKQIKVWQDIEPEDEDGVRMKAELIAQAQETIRLFTRTGRHGFDIETYLFPARKDGEWKNSGELEGSQRGTLDLAKPLIDAGYTVIGLPEQPPRPYEMTPPTSIEEWFTRESVEEVPDAS
jgi:hypothetical protein